VRNIAYMEKKAVKALLENMKVRDLLEEFDVKMRIILKWILAKQSWREGNGVTFWLSTRTSGML